MALWTSDEELFQLARQELFPAVVGDVMDKLGLLQQFLPPQIKPLAPAMVVIGRAMPVLEADVADIGADGPSNAFGLLFHALDDLKPDEVYICTGASPSYALWGGLMSTRARQLRSGRRRSQRLLPRYQRNPRAELPGLQLWRLCPGPGTPRQSRRLWRAD